MRQPLYRTLHIRNNAYIARTILLPPTGIISNKLSVKKRARQLSIKLSATEITDLRKKMAGFFKAMSVRVRLTPFQKYQFRNASSQWKSDLLVTLWEPSVRPRKRGLISFQGEPTDYDIFYKINRKLREDLYLSSGRWMYSPVGNIER